MALRTSPLLFSPENKSIQINKTLPCLNPASVSPYQVKPFELRLKTAGKTENYEKKKHGHQNLKQKAKTKRKLIYHLNAWHMILWLKKIG